MEFIHFKNRSGDETFLPEDIIRQLRSKEMERNPYYAMHWENFKAYGATLKSIRRAVRAYLDMVGKQYRLCIEQRGDDARIARIPGSAQIKDPTKEGFKRPGPKSYKYDFDSLKVGEAKLVEKTNRNTVKTAFNAWKARRLLPDAKIEIVQIDDDSLLVSRIE